MSIIAYKWSFVTGGIRSLVNYNVNVSIEAIYTSRISNKIAVMLITFGVLTTSHIIIFKFIIKTLTNVQLSSPHHSPLPSNFGSDSKWATCAVV